jgi:hypothetical protein
MQELVHTRHFEALANSGKFVACIHSAPQTKQPIVENAASAIAAAGVHDRQANVSPDYPRPAVTVWWKRDTRLARVSERASR